MNYTDRQLNEINDNLKHVNIKAKDVLRAIKNNEDIKNKDISALTNISGFVVDKCIAALISTGLVKTLADGATKYYKITEDGKKFLQVNKVEGER